MTFTQKQITKELIDILPTLRATVSSGKELQDLIFKTFFIRVQHQTLKKLLKMINCPFEPKAPAVKKVKEVPLSTYVEDEIPAEALGLPSVLYVSAVPAVSEVLPIILDFTAQEPVVPTTPTTATAAIDLIASITPIAPSDPVNISNTVDTPVVSTSVPDLQVIDTSITNKDYVECCAAHQHLQQLPYIPPPVVQKLVWTDELIAIASNLWTAGAPIKEIVEATGFTKNAIIGKVNRLNLTRPQGKLNIIPKRNSVGGFENVILSKLVPHQCRWPIGTDNLNRHLFCGKPSLELKPYCQEHFDKSISALVPPAFKVKTAYLVNAGKFKTESLAYQWLIAKSNYSWVKSILKSQQVAAAANCNDADSKVG